MYVPLYSRQWAALRDAGWIERCRVGSRVLMVRG
jgi:hypothetical protein